MAIKYYSLKNILSVDAEYNIIMGRRGPGKSFAIKEYSLSRIFEELGKKGTETNKKFMYLRRYDADMSITSVENYFEDFVIKKDDGKSFIEKLSRGRFNCIKAGRRKIFACKREIDEKTGKPKDEDIVQIGYYINLSSAQSQKSQSFLDCDLIIFEEFLAFGQPYLPNEPALLEMIISTVSRGRKIQVFLIGNTDDRKCIYFDYFCLDRIKKQKAGTIDVYQRQEEYEDGEIKNIKFAVEYTSNEFGGKDAMSFSKGSKVLETGDWRCDLDQPILFYEDFEKMEKVYHLVMKRKNSCYDCWFLYDEKEDGFIWYVQEKTRPILKNTRVISDVVSTNKFYTNNMKSLNDGEKNAFDMMINGKVMFHDNLTAREFKETLSFFVNNNTMSF